jgi:transcription elongation factor GreA
MEEKVYLTSEGFQKIKEELENLRNKTRPNVVERLSLARMQGDLSENNEYASARDELAFIDGRIEELAELLQKVVLMDSQHCGCGAVGFGCRVTIKNGKDESIYHIVGEWEADPAKKKVSHSSPLGKALLGRRVGEEVKFEAPAGKILYKIINID